jgi:Cd2+/Zn2+-exporting ATPase
MTMVMLVDAISLVVFETILDVQYAQIVPYELNLLIFLFSLGYALQERALDSACNAVRGLGELAPHKAVVRKDGSEEVIPVEKLAPDDVVLVRPGECLPVDGMVNNGSSYLNAASVTGESLPVVKTSGEKVFAGTLNTDGMLAVRVTHLAKDSTLSRVMKPVEQAEASQSPTQLWVERFTRVYVPVVLAGIAQAARNGVENPGRLQAIAFDKTGTLTLGELQVSDLCALPGFTENQGCGAGSGGGRTLRAPAC